MHGGANNRDIVVGVADMAIATAGPQRLVTYALGSCMGLSAYDPVARVGGLLHYMLPAPGARAEPPGAKPCRFASIAMPLLLHRLVVAGAQVARLVLCAAGGAEMLRGAARSTIGRRNREALQQLLAQLGLSLAAADTGGFRARTLSLELTQGEVRSRSREAGELVWTPGPLPILRQAVES
jgi:chemotaxis protein CheD